ncbi:aromatase/cyclase [Streptomyces xiamenensis]
MAQSAAHRVEHHIAVHAPAVSVYRLLSDVTRWPCVFPPTIHAELLERGGEGEERIRIWATAGDQVRSWTSRRQLSRKSLRIDFRQEVSSRPLTSMGGAWILEPTTDHHTWVRLLHDYRAESPEGLRWADEVVERNSRSELAALKAHAETASGPDGLGFAFEDTVQINGSPGDVFAFVNDAGLWPERLPHVAGVRFREEPPGLQTLEMDTVARDGSRHTTKSYRLAFPPHRILYKQVTLPPLLTLHTGVWTFRQNSRGVAASSRHTVALDPGAITTVLGPGTRLPEAREYVRTALSTNSTATLNLAKRFAESGARP